MLIAFIASVPGIFTLFSVLQFCNIPRRPRLLNVQIPLQFVSFETKGAARRWKEEVHGSSSFTLETWVEEKMA
jgi:hypothetical protein